MEFAFEAELLGFITTIKNLCKYKLTNLCVETDSINVVMAFKSRTTNIPWRFRRWLWALDFANSMNICVSNIYREDNCIADKLASIATYPSEDLYSGFPRLAS